jgi:hypothetical protein
MCMCMCMCVHVSDGRVQGVDMERLCVEGWVGYRRSGGENTHLQHIAYSI